MQSAPAPPDHGHPRLAAVAAAILGLNVVVLLTSLWCVLFGPAQGVLLGVLGFLISVAGVIVVGSGRKRGAPPPRSSSPQLHAGPGALAGTYPWIGLLKAPLAALMALCSIAIVICLVLMFGVMRSDGVPEGAAADLHILAERPVYRLNQGGEYTEVSRTRFVAAGASFMVGWHSLALFISLLALQHLLFGEDRK